MLTEQGLPTGVVVGFQVLTAATGTVAIARTTTGVIERPAGSGNYVLNFISPVVGDLYLVVSDWSGGVLAPETSRVSELIVTSAVVAGSSGLGAVADYVKMNMGGETWRLLTNSADYGQTFVVRAIELVKRRAMQNPPVTADEGALDPRVLDYLGILASLQLVSAARDAWGSQVISKSEGDSPAERVTFANRAELMDELLADLMRKLAAAQAEAIPLIDLPVLSLATVGPMIDEDDDLKVTDDPREFPTYADFPGQSLYVDAFGYAIFKETGVRL